MLLDDTEQHKLKDEFLEVGGINKINQTLMGVIIRKLLGGGTTKVMRRPYINQKGAWKSNPRKYLQLLAVKGQRDPSIDISVYEFHGYKMLIPQTGEPPAAEVITHTARSPDSLNMKPVPPQGVQPPAAETIILRSSESNNVIPVHPHRVQPPAAEMTVRSPESFNPAPVALTLMQSPAGVSVQLASSASISDHVPGPMGGVATELQFDEGVFLTMELATNPLGPRFVTGPGSRANDVHKYTTTLNDALSEFHASEGTFADLIQVVKQIDGQLRPLLAEKARIDKLIEPLEAEKKVKSKQKTLEMDALNSNKQSAFQSAEDLTIAKYHERAPQLKIWATLKTNTPLCEAMGVGCRADCRKLSRCIALEYTHGAKNHCYHHSPFFFELLNNPKPGCTDLRVKYGMRHPEISTSNGNGNGTSGFVQERLADYLGFPLCDDSKSAGDGGDSKSAGDNDEEEKRPASKLSDDELMRELKRRKLEH